MTEDKSQVSRYFVYENWTVESKAVIHRSECPFCKDGSGIHPLKQEGRNGRWHGPFNTYGQARHNAGLLGRTIKECHFCKPTISKVLANSYA